MWSLLFFRFETFLEIFFSSSTIASTPCIISRCSEVGFAPAVTFLRPSRKIASARTVAVVLCHRRRHWRSWKRPRGQAELPFFVRVLELDFLRHGNAVFRDGWAPEFLVQDDVASGRFE